MTGMRRLAIKAQEELTEDKAWLLGFMAGDGNVDIAADGGAHVSANCGADEDLARHAASLLESIYNVPVTAVSVRLERA